MPKAKDLVLFDKRVIARSLRKGRITKADLEQFLSGLPDAAKRGTEIRALTEFERQQDLALRRLAE